jgi:hypothetical protein
MRDRITTMQKTYTCYCPGALLGLGGSALALAGLYTLPLATITLSSTGQFTAIDTHSVTEWSFLAANPPGIGNALVATLIIIAVLLLTINLTILRWQVSTSFIILARLLAITGTIVQAALCLLILFSTTIISASSGQPIQITSTSLGLFLLLSLLTTAIGAFLIPLP